MWSSEYCRNFCGKKEYNNVLIVTFSKIYSGKQVWFLKYPDNIFFDWSRRTWFSTWWLKSIKYLVKIRDWDSKQHWMIQDMDVIATMLWDLLNYLNKNNKMIDGASILFPKLVHEMSLSRPLCWESVYKNFAKLTVKEMKIVPLIELYSVDIWKRVKKTLKNRSIRVFTLNDVVRRDRQCSFSQKQFS